MPQQPTTEYQTSPRAPRLRTVLLVVHLLILCLPLAGIFLLRLYDSLLVRQTESELIVQGAAVAAAQRAALREVATDQGVELDGYGNLVVPADEPVPRHEPDEIDSGEFDTDEFDPGIAGLDLARHPVLDDAAPGRPPEQPPESLALAAGASLVPQLEDLQRVSLAGIRVVDPAGIVVATTGAEDGLSLAHRPEVAAALEGRKISILRRRFHDGRSPALDDIQRPTPWRVVVAFPIESLRQGAGEPRIWGAVVLARTPLSMRQALWRERGHLMAGGLLILVVVSLVTLWTAATVGRPVRRLIAQAERVARGERGAATPLRHPGTHEVARISEAVARMAASLEERADYIATFAANVSHEFKTPLTSMRGAVELLDEHEDDMSPEERQRFLAMLDRDAQRLERLVDRLLELARADVHHAGDESASVAASLERLGRRFEEARIEDDTPPGTGVAMAPETLDSVLGNLLDNAHRHTDGRVELRAATSDRGVQFDVEDDGPGISEANLPRVFDRFFTTRRDDGGSGLGLAIVRALVVAHGGEVAVESRPGRTVFRVQLPRRTAQGTGRARGEMA